MNKPGHILKQINLINLALAGVLLFFIYAFFSLVNASFEFRLPEAEPSVTAAEEESAKTAESALPYLYDYTIITEQNLFHPDRKMVAGSAKAGEHLVRPDFVLYGTMITDDSSIAFLDDMKAPRATPGRGKRQWALSIGDKLSGYTLSEVYADGAVMVNEDDRIELAVIDPSKQRGSEIISTGEESKRPAGTGRANNRTRRTVPANPPSDRTAETVIEDTRRAMPANPGEDIKDYINQMKSRIQPSGSRGTK